MRIAFLSCNARAGDAIGNQLAEKVVFFRERGADVRVFVEDDRHLHPGVRSCCQALRAPHEAHGPAWDYLTSADLVFVDYGQHYGLLDLLPPLARNRVRIVFNYHGITPTHLWGPHNREAIERGAQQRGLVWCADAALVHSRFAARELREPTGFPSERIACLGHPLDPAWLAPRAATGELRHRLGLNEASLLLFVGRLAPNKRLPVLIEAVAHLRSRTPAVHALVIGDDGDAYQSEAERCRARAAELDVADRLHFLGHVDDGTLRAAYQAADVFVMPSLHEGFCIPVIEAMASGLPVIAARAAALPETVGSAGLTFTADDSADLARQVGRVLDARSAESKPVGRPERLRVAVVASRYDEAFVGGAEASLRLMAQTLHRGGHRVEVFTTSPAAKESSVHEQDGMTVHRFPLAPCDTQRQAAALQQIEQGQAHDREDAGRSFLEQAPHAPALLAELGRRMDDFDAVLVGPYLSRLTFEVARCFPARTVLMPCFHDEPAARLESLLAVYREVGGLLYHSAEEQELAEAELGVNHPNAACVGTVIDVQARGDAQRGQQRVGTGRKYVVYCGRYAVEKGVGLLLDHARRYAADHPERFTFAFVGDGAWPIPREPWACDLGFVDAVTLRDVLAGAAALVQLSQRESLSLAALEAWAQGVPVLAHGHSAVLVGHVERGQGGRVLCDYDDFAAALDDLWHDPQRWQALGRQGQTYVREQYGSEAAFLKCLAATAHGLRQPLAERMRRRGRQRAEQHQREQWRERFARLVEEWLHAAPRPWHEEVEVQPRGAERFVTVGMESVLLPVRVVNRGTHAVVADGPGRVVVRCRLLNAAGETYDTTVSETPLPALLVPGAALAFTVRVAVPRMAGVYQVVFASGRADEPSPVAGLESHLRLVVAMASPQDSRRTSMPLGATVQQALASAERLRKLPDDYLDVTQGWFAAWKRAVKRKLLNNFKKAYVDVVARQQSAFNQHVLTALQELAESFAALEMGTKNQGAGEQPTAASCLTPDPWPLTPVLQMLAESQRRCAALEERLARLEARYPQEEVPS